MRNQIHNLSYTRTCDASRCPSDIRNLLVESQIRFVTEIRVWLAREPRFILFWTLFHTVAVPTQFFVPANTNDYALLRPEIWRHLEARVPLCDREILHDLVFPRVFHLHLENYTEMLRIICVELRGDLPTEQADHRVCIPEARQIWNAMKIVLTFAQEETGSGCLAGFFEISSTDSQFHEWCISFHGIRKDVKKGVSGILKYGTWKFLHKRIVVTSLFEV